jgi:hypothetical protein
MSTDYTAKVEEVDVRMFKSCISTYRHHTNDPSTPVSETVHHILRVTLKDRSVWALDVAGAQHGQHNPVVPFTRYARDSIAKILATRAFGTSSRNIHDPVNTRNPGNPGNILFMLQLSQTLENQIDELTEWEHQHVAVPELLKVKREAYQSLKTTLVAHLATQARESLKHIQGDPSSTYRPIVVSSYGMEGMSDEEKSRMERKRARKVAGMDTDTRRLWEEQEKKGTPSLMF